MASNMFSRLVPASRGTRSFYQDLRGDGHVDVGDRAGLLDEENLNQSFHDYDLEDARGLGVDDSHNTLRRESMGSPRHHPSDRAQHIQGGPSAWISHDDDGDNDVPASLLVEHHDADPSAAQGQSKRQPKAQRTPAVPGSSKARIQWEATQAQQRLHADEPFAPSRQGHGAPRSIFPGAMGSNARKLAEWRWANVSNLDKFIKDVYDYYVGAGIWCILLERGLHLINVAFVTCLLTFLTQCVDYGKIRGSQKLSQILVPQCTKNMSGLWSFGVWMFAFYFVWKSIQFLLDLPRLFHVRDFYIYLLNIPDQDMQTITWQDVVHRVMALRDQNAKTNTKLPKDRRRWLGAHSKERLDASDIANRLMRKENYLIALFNKDVLDLTIPMPLLRTRQMFSRILEWMLMFSVLDFVFDEKGQVNQEFLKSDRRGVLSKKLKERFLFAGCLTLVLSPFIAGYLCIVYFLTYYYEVQKNPSVLSSRTYTPLAEWKFREFNELPHSFRKRLDMSQPYASHYMDQFPKVKTEMIAKTVVFVTGSLATILAIASVVDPELFLGFEITHDRTVLFYTALFGSIWHFARGSVSDDNSVFDPEYAMRNVIDYTHYEPDHWKGHLHSYDIKLEFAELYKIKTVIFLEEILSILVTPFILFFSLPKSSDQIIDFFREFTIHVDGLGYVCSFAEFDFKRGLVKGPKAPEGADVRDEYYSTKHGKMEHSYYTFLGNYGNFALNPKTGAPSHLTPGMRHHQFHPPPAWPGMSSPTLTADLQASRTGRGDRARSKAAGKAPWTGPVPQPSPMASILLDPHHQPSSQVLGSRAVFPPRQQRGGHHAERDIIEESIEDDGDVSDGGRRRVPDEDAYESGGALDESAWQTSPARTLSRDNSGIEGAPDAGVVHMIYQFNQAQLNRRPGGVR